jgi:transcriptional regulator with XRE-family HTH domain
VNTVEYQQVLGRKVAQERRRHGLSQPELAAMVDRPVSWVSQLERGVQPIDRLSVLQNLADALALPLAELAGGDDDVAAGGPADDGGPAAASALRVVLAGAHSLRAMLGESTPPSAAELRARTERACALARADRFGELAKVLGELLPGLELACRAAPPGQQPDLYELTAICYQTCAAALAKLGEPMASWIAADRAMIAAERAGNLLLAAATSYRLASVFLDAQQHCLAEEAARTAVSALTSLAELGDPDALSLSGGLTLLRAVVAARTGHPSAAFAHLSRARQLAAQLGCQPAAGLPEFNGHYVALYEIAVSVDVGDAGHALRMAATLDLAALPPSRRARVLIDVARAYALRKQVGEAVQALTQAEALRPWADRDVSRARQVISDLMALDGAPPAALTLLAGRLSAGNQDARP